MRHPPEVSRGLGDRLGQHIPGAEPHFRGLPSSEDELAIGIAIDKLLEVETHGQIGRRCESLGGDQIEIGMAEIGVARFDRGGEYFAIPHVENFGRFVHVLRVESLVVKLVEGECEGVSPRASVAHSHHLQFLGATFG